MQAIECKKYKQRALLHPDTPWNPAAKQRRSPKLTDFSFRLWASSAGDSWVHK